MTAERRPTPECLDHEWMVCDTCGEAMMRCPVKIGKRCRMTAGCQGVYKRPGNSPLRWPQDPVPAR